MPEAANPRLFSFYLSAMHDLGRALQSEPRRVRSSRPIHESLYRILGTFAIGRGALLVCDESGEWLELAAAKGLRKAGELEHCVNEARKEFNSASQIKRLAAASRPYRSSLPPGGLESLTAALRPTLQRMRLSWVVPLSTGASFVGLLMLGDRVNGNPLTKLELEVLEEMGSLLALRIDDARNRRRLAEQVRELQKTQRQMRQIFLETIRTLAGVIDGHEPGGGPSHSVRVASLSTAIAIRLKLPHAARERLYVAGLLHDIGKQVINQDILGKNAPLDDDERLAVERHPAAASELISHIQFPWGDVAEIIRHHHERLDGRGYPDKLSGEQISLEARILMMAEAFDSMTSDQPWRPRLAMPKIVEQISNNLGIQFEPRVVAALCDVVEAGLDMSEEPPEFIANLEAGFDPNLIRQTLRELRRQIATPTLRQVSARVIDATRRIGE
jgi:HD-GYP domain-containing protein (c-di-GMP phosphodiesterase class II)